MALRIILFFFLAAAAGADDARPVTICDVLQDPAKWNGKMVEVAGPIMTAQNLWVMGRCDRALEVKGSKFLTGFVLEYPSNKKLISHKVEFDWDEESKSELYVLTEEAMRTNRTVFATVVGMFETRIPVDSLIDANAPYKYRGFGHMGEAPGQIIVKTVKGMRIEQKDPLAK
jgi:hypothetical protein